MKLTGVQRGELVKFFYSTGSNAEAALREYRRVHNIRSGPCSRVAVHKLIKKFEETGCTCDKPRSGRPPTPTEVASEISRAGTDPPSPSPRVAGRRLDLPNSTCDPAEKARRGSLQYLSAQGRGMEGAEVIEVDRSGLVSEDGKNAKTVLCQRCGSKVLCPGMALFAEKELFLPAMMKKRSTPGSLGEGSVSGEQLKDHWLVDDMYAFENVGFTKDVGNVKYLICADCEVGPIGWHCLDDKKSFYVALERVKHE
ncbi:hypothetical protein AOXY_G30778 [Acipenser oxyrinchus oxyrinchus]|uniref:Guanine nucleotide exchange factor MSS4 n=2 Tax=Acipenseridae TaxID=7900 RepID=A0AAD8CM92_ACIOX|nr:hypothetical protein AOXY_G30778 [Acipenser oxyrinchus oxyrinchus]